MNRSRLDDKGKLRVFISYSRDDEVFPDQLKAALESCEFECFIDRQDIPAGEEWRKRLGDLIVGVDAVVFVLSRASIRSDICIWEVDESLRLGKRILPVIGKSLGGASLPPRLQEFQHIFFYQEPAESGSGWGDGLKRLVGALKTDIEWLREHTRYLQRATEWDSRGRPTTHGLLYGDDITEAKDWIARRPKNVPNTPEPTDLQRAFIQVSELGAEAQLRAERIRQQQLTAVLENAIDIIVKVQRHFDDNMRQVVFAFFRSGADLGDSASMMNLGRAYYAGHGVAQDYTKAREWYEKAAEKGEWLAMSGLGTLYDAGYGVAQDYSKAREWYEKAAERGDATAMTRLGNLYEAGHGVAQDYAKAREWFEKAAGKGEAHAMQQLGSLYRDGRGVPQDYAKERELYEKAAENGDTTAMMLLGLLYRDGRGVTRDYGKAREWYEKAAEKGDPSAMQSLGLAYHRGQGVAQDYAKAREWYEKAASKGDTRAMTALGLIYYSGHGVATDYAEAREWYEKAAEKGFAPVMGLLGLLYETGRGVAQDYAKAREWYEKAAEKGETAAMANLEGLSIRETAEAGRYAESLQLAEARAAKEEAEETKSGGEPGKKTAQALGGLAWCAVLAREFAKALTAADRAHALLPEDLGIESNRAHALMFMGRGQESEALYLAHKGERMSEDDSRPWESAIAKDFADLRKAGVTHAMMVDIEWKLSTTR